MSDWIRWNGRGCPVDQNAMVLIRLETDRHPDEGRLKRPCRAGRYPWTRNSGITHYMVAGEGDKA